MLEQEFIIEIKKALSPVMEMLDKKYPDAKYISISGYQSGHVHVEVTLPDGSDIRIGWDRDKKNADPCD